MVPEPEGHWGAFWPDMVPELAGRWRACRGWPRFRSWPSALGLDTVPELSPLSAATLHEFRSPPDIPHRERRMHAGAAASPSIERVYLEDNFIGDASKGVAPSPRRHACHACMRVCVRGGQHVREWREIAAD